MDRKPTPRPQPDPAATNNANEAPGEGDSRSDPRGRKEQQPQYVENEGLAGKTVREIADPLGGVEGESLKEAHIASQRGLTATS